ncbi:MAG TPA: hypothetical protein VGS19_14530 [Streptosporangiaceae bacterium]|nr:hypothetical protein [Streptosporangiaceae bacterium]
MSPSAALLVIIVGVVGGYLGWHIRHAKQANDDLKVHKQRIPRFRSVRNNSVLITVAGIVIGLLVLQTFFHH